MRLSTPELETLLAIVVNAEPKHRPETVRSIIGQILVELRVRKSAASYAIERDRAQAESLTRQLAPNHKYLIERERTAKRRRAREDQPAVLAEIETTLGIR